MIVACMLLCESDTSEMEITKFAFKMRAYMCRSLTQHIHSEVRSRIIEGWIGETDNLLKIARRSSRQTGTLAKDILLQGRVEESRKGGSSARLA